MKIRREQFGPDVIFVDEENDRCFRRIVGGLAWPCPPEPGFLVVVGEDFDRDLILSARHFRLLAEAEGATLTDLGRQCLEFTYQYHPTWYSNPSQRAMVEMLNQGQEKRIAISEAPYFDSPQAMALYSQMIADLTRPHHKVLHLGEHSRLPGYLLNRAGVEMAGNAAAYPPLAALGYAVAVLRLREPFLPGKIEVLASHDYHPLDRGRK